MKTTEWTEIKEVFNAAINLNESDRSTFLADYSKNLRFEVEKLLKANDGAADFILEPAMVEIGLSDADAADFYIGKQIDSYRIIRQIGHGGMGTVYLANRADESYDKPVAVKLIKRGMDTNAVLKRFVMERQILANLEHPNIAGLLDGGSTTDGLPYLVMEYVEGEPITKFCDSHGFSTPERLELFRKVCSAVSHAHQNLVVHRDIKPSNILVTEDGTPKLLDFGIAKLLHPDWSLDTNEATATMFRVMTPEYASPEQVRGLPITTASDVYSLGVVLYELLSGERPYKIDSRLPDEAARIVLTAEPIKPSSVVSFESKAKGSTSNVLTDEKNDPPTTNGERKTNPKSKIPNPKSLKGDLDNIVLKALRKEPERRYPSVQEFSEDIRRHLAGLPVTATADTTFYRCNKFIKRHSVGVLSGGLIVLTLLAATTITTWQAIVAKRERNNAEQHFRDLRKLTNSFLFEFHDAVKDLQGATQAREMTVKKALEYLDILAREQLNDSSLQFELANAYSKVANIQGYPGASNLGDTGGAVESYRKAIEILEKLTQIAPNNHEFQKELALNYKSIAFIYENTGDSDLSLSNNRSALDLYQNLVALDETDFNTKLELGDCYKSLGDLTAAKGNLEEALQYYRKTLEMSESVLQSHPDNNKAKTKIMVACDAIGATLGNPNFTNLGDTDGALQAYRRQLEIGNKMLEADEKSLSLQATKAFTLKVTGEVYTARNEWRKAIESYTASLEIQEKLVKTDAKDALANTRLAYLLTNLGEALANSDQLADAVAYHNRSVAIFEQLVETDKENSSLLLFLNRAYQKKGDALAAMRREVDALNFYHKALKSNEEIAAQDLKNMDMRLQLATDYFKIAMANINLAQKKSNKKQEFWTEARKRLEQSKEVYLDMQSHNLRTKPISDSIANLMKEILHCDEALAKSL